MTAVATHEPTPQTRQTLRPRQPARPIPFVRIVTLELRKMFDTRSGFWLMASIVLAAVTATAAVIAFAPDTALTYESFATAVGFPMAVILPMIAILSVTSEWSQRSGLSTFTLVPRRGRVMSAKAVAALTVAVVSIPLAFAIGALGNLIGTALTGTDTVWDVSVVDGLYIVLGNALGLLVGFMLGVVIRNSAGAIVAYFVYSLLLPSLAAVLAVFQDWFLELQPWVDFNYAQAPLFDGGPTAEQWANLATAGSIWLILPLAVGITRTMRSEVK